MGSSVAVVPVVIILNIVMGLGPAAIDKSKGRKFFTWWIFGALIFPVALPVALLMKDPNKPPPIKFSFSEAFISDINDLSPGCWTIIALIFFYFAILIIGEYGGGGDRIPRGPATPRSAPTPPLR